MADGATPALGLSVGATNFAAVTADHAITRKPVLTLYRDRLPEIGIPAENPRLDRPGLVITNFVDRVGDPIGIVAADGTVHQSEVLAADGLRALAYAATQGRPLPHNVAVTHPAHWGSTAIDALGSALSRVSEWSNTLTLIPDSAAALVAARANPGIPARGTVAVCDFGGSGTSITLMDAAGDYQPLAPAVRHPDFSGDLIDQALLTAMLSNLPSSESFDPSGTSAIGPLNRLRTGCRNAKEQLSSNTVATLGEQLPGLPGDVRITRNELDEAIRPSLTAFVVVLDETLARNGIRDLVAVVTMGGGAHIPAVTTMLSGHLRVPVVTTPRPHLAPAIGAALRAARGPGETGATQLTPAAATAAAAAVAVEDRQALLADAPPSAPVSSAMPALAWSDAGEESRSFRFARSGYTSARPAVSFEPPERAEEKKKPEEKNKPIIPWYRMPSILIIGSAVAVLLVAIALAIGLADDQPANNNPGVNTTPSSAPSSAPPPAGAATPQPAPPSQAPVTGQAVTPAPPADAPAPVDAPATADAPPPVDVPPPVDAPAAPPVQAPPAPPVPPPAPRIPPIPAIPPIPRIPGISVPIPGLGHF